MDDTIHVVSEETTSTLATMLDEQSVLKDGFAVMSLFEIEQAIYFMPSVSEEEFHLKESTYKSFEYLVSKLYGKDTYADDYIKDTKLFADLVKAKSYQ